MGGGEEGGGGVSNKYKESVCTGLILFKYATSGTVIFFQIQYFHASRFYTLIAYRRGPGVGRVWC